MLGLVPGMFPLRKVGLCKEKGRKEGEDNDLQRRDVLACGSYVSRCICACCAFTFRCKYDQMFGMRSVF